MAKGACFLAAVLASASVSGPVLAQETVGAQAEGIAEEIPPHIPTAAFAAPSQLNGARISPDGSRFALTLQRDGKTYISVFDADTRELVGGANLGEELEYNWFRWVGNSRLVFSMTGQDEYERFSYSRLYYLDLENNAMHPLVLRRMAFDGDDLVYTDPAGNYVLASIAESYRELPAIYRFDLNSGEQPEPIRVQRPESGIFEWLADETGTVRIGIGAAGFFSLTLNYRPDGTAPFRRSTRTRADNEETMRFWNFMGLRSGSDVGYTIAIPEGSDRYALMEFDFSTGLPGRVIYQSATEDVASVFFNERNEPIAIGYSGDDFRREWLDPEIARHQARLQQALPGSWVRILDISEDRSRLLVRQSGPADPGALYVFTPAERRLDLFNEYRPTVPTGLLVTPRLVRYQARDGTAIAAYLTLPMGRAPEGLPLIVMPHGGPYGVRDDDGYDDWVQLLANRGYAVIQPNYRGSGGYGEAFERLGDGQIGRAMQDDLDDAVAWLAGQGTIDPARVCLVGASYGGFAAMWGVIRNPEIYRCAASWAGVSH